MYLYMKDVYKGFALHIFLLKKVGYTKKFTPPIK